MKRSSCARQRGATLVIGLIMLAVITLLVTAAFSLSSTNLKNVSNMQFRDGALAAGQIAIEKVAQSDFTTLTAAQQITVDLDRDDRIDYTVNVDKPVCIRSAQSGTVSNVGRQSSVTLPGMTVSSPGLYSTTWDIRATVTDTVSGATVDIHQGVRKQLSAPCS
ncbi:MAG: pilus assembly PilX family protein [Burkholderiaceae bacterium]